MGKDNLEVYKISFFYFLSISLLLMSGQSILASEWVTFPRGFKWCVATAGHQIEGNNVASDWWRWEKHLPHQSGEACKSWDLVDRDIEMIQEIGATAYRFSVEWSKIEPLEGHYDQEAVTHYRREVKSLLQKKITPIITLQHFTLPQWVREKGGFEWSKMDEALGRFTKKVFLEIAPEVRYWVTINEPTNYTLAGYFTGAVPPGDARPLQRIVPVFRGILKAHAKMYQVLHLLGGRNLRVGMALQLREVQPGSYWNPLDVMLVHWVSETFNWSFPDAMTQGVLNMYIGFQLNVYERIPGLMGTQDFVGINYYGGDRVHYSLANGIERKDWDDLPDDQLDPDARPKAFYSFIKQVSKRYPKKPILILENGINDPDDSKRPQFIKSHLKYLSKAIQEGAPVIGYCHWSLMDNFEWLLGNSARFGLYETNYADYTRQPKRSALLFKNIAAQNGFQCD